MEISDSCFYDIMREGIECNILNYLLVTYFGRCSVSIISIFTNKIQ